MEKGGKRAAAEPRKRKRRRRNRGGGKEDGVERVKSEDRTEGGTGVNKGDSRDPGSAGKSTAAAPVSLAPGERITFDD